MGEMKGPVVTLTGLKPKAGAKIELLGHKKPLQWSQVGEDIKVTLPPSLPGKYAYVLGIEQSDAM